MRVLFTTTGHAGHVLPLLPFALAAADAGHDVLVAAQHSRIGQIEDAGLAAAPSPRPSGRLGAGDGRPGHAAARVANRRMLAEGFAGLMVDAALPTCSRWSPTAADLVERETFEFAGPLAAERHGVPVARVALGLERTERWAVAGAAPAQVAETGAGITLAGAPRGTFTAPGADALAALPGAVRDVLADGGFRRAAGALAAASRRCRPPAAPRTSSPPRRVTRSRSRARRARRPARAAGPRS